jgi:hypothetical protein
MYCKLFYLLAFKIVEKAETAQVHFTLGGEGLKAQKKVCGWKVYMESYMADYG